MALCKSLEIANVKWTATQIISFLDLLQKYECLWRLTDKDRKNRQCRDMAFEGLLSEVQEVVGPSDIDMITMKSKMKNLKTVYSRELAKVLKSERNGETYIPGLRWYSVADSFLRHSKEAKEITLSTDDIHELLGNELNHGSMSDSECEVVQAIDASHNYSKDPLSIHFEDSLQESSVVSLGTTASCPNVKPKNSTSFSHRSSNGISSSSKNSSQKIKRKSEDVGLSIDSCKSLRSSEVDDQFYAFGLYVASELRQLRDDTQLKLAKHYINSILFDASMSALLPP